MTPGKRGELAKVDKARRPKPSICVQPTEARKWLRANGYEDIANLIDKLILAWAQKGLRTRRNWWKAQSGGVGGRPFTVCGQEIPVLVSAQRRQKKPVTGTALQRGSRESVPPVRSNGRWP
jgi:hypothetical protein